MIPDKIVGIMQALFEHGHEAYIIGGAVRDGMMGIDPKDWDVFTDASGDEILSIFPEGKVIGNKDRQEKILTVVVRGVEVSQYRTNGDRTETGVSLEKHLSTCDFTINSMAMDINGGIIDKYYGARDLQHRVISTVGSPEDRITEDKLRVLRAVRFSVKYNFSINDHLIDVITNTDISTIPVERIREEVLKILMYPDGLTRLVYYNLLEQIIPEFEQCFLMNGGKHHDETVDNHMFNAQNITCGLTDNPVLVFACAFHDIGKGRSYQIKVDGGISFHNHEKVGAEIIRSVMERMKFSNADIKYVEALVGEHMFGPWSNEISNRAFVKHFKRLEDAGVSIEDYMVLLYSDNQGNSKNRRIKFGDFIRGNKLHKKYYELKFSNTPFSVKDLAISGKDLLDAGVKPGVEIGNTLNSVFNEVVGGNLDNERHVLMRYIKTRL